jgi:hypothetical protein
MIRLLPRWCGWLVGVVTILLIAPIAHATSAPYVVLETQGTVSVDAPDGKKSGAGKTPAVLSSIAAGARVTLAADGLLVVFRSGDATVLRWRGPLEVVLPSLAEGAPGDDAARARLALPPALRGVRINLDAAAQASLVMRSGAADRLRVTAPIGMLLPGEVPEIRWEGGSAHAPVRITIADWQGNRVVSEDTSASTWTPELERPLIAGTRYRYSVFGRAHDGRPGENDFGEFRVLTQADAARLLALRPEAEAPVHERRLYIAALRSARAFQAAQTVEKSIRP